MCFVFDPHFNTQGFWYTAFWSVHKIIIN